MIITTKWLEDHNACEDGIDRFNDWSGGAAPLQEIADRHPHVADLCWLVDRLCPADVRQSIALICVSFAFRLAYAATQDGRLLPFCDVVTPEMLPAARKAALSAWSASLAAWDASLATWDAGVTVNATLNAMASAEAADVMDAMNAAARAVSPLLRSTAKAWAAVGAAEAAVRQVLREVEA